MATTLFPFLTIASPIFGLLFPNFGNYAILGGLYFGNLYKQTLKVVLESKALLSRSLTPIF